MTTRTFQSPATEVRSTLIRARAVRGKQQWKKKGKKAMTSKEQKAKQSFHSQLRASLLQSQFLCPSLSRSKGDLEHEFCLPHVASAVPSRGACFERSDRKAKDWDGRSYTRQSQLWAIVPSRASIDTLCRAICRKASYLSQDPRVCSDDPHAASLQGLIYPNNLVLEATETIISSSAGLRLHHQSCPRNMAGHEIARNPRSLNN